MRRVLVVDDEPANVRLLERILRREGDVEVLSTSDPREAMPMVEAHSPEVALLDVNMPHLDGLTLLGMVVRRHPVRAAFPVIVLTADANPDTKHRALREGASDFLVKPLDAVEVVLRVRQQLEWRRIHAELTAQAEILERQVGERTRDLEEAQVEILDRLARATEARDDDTGEHVGRVAATTGAIARAMGVDEGEARLMEQAVRLHDVGKISVPDGILLKAGPLDADERVAMQAHAAEGARILGGSRFDLLRRAEEIAAGHHERWNGTGYPSGAIGEEIPLAARIAAVADVFDALTSARPYKKAWSLKDAVREVVRGAGDHFDPAVVEAFLTALPEILASTGRHGLARAA